MIKFRYFSKEILSAMTATTVVLLLVFMSTQFVRYLGYAAGGSIPVLFVFKLMLLEVGNLIGLLLPIGFFLGVLLAYGRLYADSEMTVFSATGMTRARLVSITLGLAALLALLDGAFMLWIGPSVANDRYRILLQGRSASVVDTIIPGRFTPIQGGRQVIYVESINRDRTIGQNVFMARLTPKHDWEMLTAQSAKVHTDGHQNNWLEFGDGQAYVGKPGDKDFQVIEFKQLEQRLPPILPPTTVKERTLPSTRLWPLNNTNKAYAAELQWRVAMPLSILILGLLAVPLSYVRPRQGKYAKLIPAVILYVVYANFLFVGRNWIVNGAVTPNVGLWWLHGSMLLIAFLLYFPPKRWFTV
jgi:lipopolysaccharide export system permease protein